MSLYQESIIYSYHFDSCCYYCSSFSTSWCLPDLELSRPGSHLLITVSGVKDMINNVGTQALDRSECLYRQGGTERALWEAEEKKERRVPK